MSDEGPGRPRTLVRRHIIDIKPDSRAWLAEQFDSFRTTFAVTEIARGTVRSAGEVLKGAVSHPIGIAIIAGSLTAILTGVFGGSGSKEDDLIEKVKEQLKAGDLAVPDVFFEVWRTTYEISRFMFPFLPIFPTVGSDPPIPPPTEKERLCAQLAKEMELAKQNLQDEPGQADFWQDAIARVAARQIEVGC